MNISTEKKFALIVFAAAAVLYLPILSAEFVYDDIEQIQIDTYIHTPANFQDVFSLKVMSRDIIDNNRPVMVLSLMLDSLVWEKSPFGYHLTNLVLHALCSAMVFLVLYRFLNRIDTANKSGINNLWVAFIAGLIYALHPINSEAVCVITFREDLLAVFFTLLLFIAAEHFPASRRGNNILLSVVVFFLVFVACGAKETGAAVPFYLLIYWFVFRKRQQWRKWTVPIIAGFAAAGLFLFLRFNLVPTDKAVYLEIATRLGGTFRGTMAIQPRIWVFQLLEIFWPSLLCADITGYYIRFITLRTAIAVLVVIIFITIFISRKNQVFAAGVLFYILALLPVSNFIIIFRPVADRYMYLPMFGVCLAFASIIHKLKIERKIYKIAALGITGVLLLYLCCFTLERQLVWHDSVSLWHDTVTKNPYSYTGNNGYAFALFKNGDYEQAIPFLTQASLLEPKSANPLAALAVVYDELKMPEKANQYAQKAITLNKQFLDHKNLTRYYVWTKKDAQKFQAIVDRIIRQPE